MLIAMARRGRRIRGLLTLFGGASVIAVGLAQSQTETAPPKFNVVSIRPCRNADVGPGGGERWGRSLLAQRIVADKLRNGGEPYSSGIP